MQASDRIPLSLEPKGLDYIAQCLAARPWGEVHALLADIQQQVAAFNRMQLEPHVKNGGDGNGVAQASNSH